MKLQRTRASGIMVCTVLVIAFSSTALAGSGDGQAAKLNKIAGPTYAQLAQDWWQYYIRLPSGISPDDIPGGPIDCMFGQKGNVWFVPSPAGFALREYECTVKQKALFFPLLTEIVFNAEIFGPPWTIDEKLSYLDGGEQIFCGRAVLDGVQTSRTYPSVFIQSTVFTYESGDDLFARIFGFAPGEVVDEETVAAGLYVLLPPLPPGDHTLEIFAGIGCDELTGAPALSIVENSYFLTVVDDDDSDDDDSDDDD